jgi:hypothetical protein
VHVGKFFARNLGGLIRARTCAGPAREGKSRTPSMYAGEKSDEVVVPRKRPNKERQLPAEVVEGRASPEGNSRQAAVVRTRSRAATSIRLADVRRSACGFKPCAPPTFDPREEPGALAALAGICAGGEEKSSSRDRKNVIGKGRTDSDLARLMVGSSVSGSATAAIEAYDGICVKRVIRLTWSGAGFW